MGFKCAAVEERISFYADDILLYLGDVRSSLGSVMTIITKFGNWLGPRINWDKSALLPIDLLPLPLPVEAVQFQVVLEFKYLGITVSARPFLALNVSTLLARMADKINTGCRLPLLEGVIL